MEHTYNLMINKDWRQKTIQKAITNTAKYEDSRIRDIWFMAAICITLTGIIIKIFRSDASATIIALKGICLPLFSTIGLLGTAFFVMSALRDTYRENKLLQGLRAIADGASLASSTEFWRVFDYVYDDEERDDDKKLFQLVLNNPNAIDIKHESGSDIITISYHEYENWHRTFLCRKDKFFELVDEHRIAISLVNETGNDS